MAISRIQILDSNLNPLTYIETPVPLNSQGDILQYSKELSDFGRCKFRVSSYDPNFTTYGDILKPHAYHVRITRAGTTVWQGAIIDNLKRTKDYIEVQAVEYLWYLSRILVKRSSVNPVTGASDAIYRVFDNNLSDTTMSGAVTTIMNETIAQFQGTNHALASLTLGTIDNPNYPPNMTDGATPTANALSGPWKFGNGVTAPKLTYDFQTILYILKSFGAYTFADFNIDSSLKFNFRSFLGNNLRYQLSLIWGQHGNAVDFNLPRLGERMFNDIWGIATQNDGTVIHSEMSDQPSITTNGLLQGPAAFANVVDQATLNARVAAELPLISTPEGAAVTMVMDETAYPLGLYDVGDIVTVQVKHTAVTYSAPKRIVGFSVNVHNTGRELTTLQLNTPLNTQLT